MRSGAIVLTLGLLSCGAFGASSDDQPAAGFDAPIVLARGEITPRGIAADEREVFWASEEGGEIRATTLEGGAGVRVVVRDDNGPREVLVDASTVYFTDTQGGCCGAALLRAPKTGDRPTGLIGSSNSQAGRRLAFDGRSLLASVLTFGDGESVVTLAADGSSTPLPSPRRSRRRSERWRARGRTCSGSRPPARRS